MANAFLDSYIQGAEQSRRSDLAAMQERSAAIQNAGALQKLQQEQAYRSELSGADTPEKQLAVALKYGGPAAAIGHADRLERASATREATMQRLTQQAQQFDMNWQLRYKAATTQEERLNLEKQREMFKQTLQSEAQRLAGAKANYEFGFQPSAPISPTIPTATERPQNEQDAIRMVQSGQAISARAAPGQPAEMVRPSAAPAPITPSPAPTPPSTPYNVDDPEIRRFAVEGAGPTPAAPVATSQVVAPAPKSIADMPPEIKALPLKMQQKWIADNAKMGGGMSGADFTKTGEDFLQTVPPTDRAFVKKLAAYEIDPKTLSTRGGERERALKMAAQYDPNFDQKNYNTISNAVNKFATGQQGNTVRSLNVAVEHIDTLRRAADALKNGQFTPGNAVYNEVSKVWGLTPANNFEAIRDIVANEVVKGTIGGTGALQDREEAAKKVKASQSPQQLNELMDKWLELMGGQAKGLERQYEGATQRKDFRDKYLAPKTLAAISLAEQKGGASGDSDLIKKYLSK